MKSGSGDNILLYMLYLIYNRKKFLVQFYLYIYKSNIKTHLFIQFLHKTPK